MQRQKNYRQALREAAMGRRGYVTTADAVEMGVPPKELPKLAEHGAFANVGYGLYRFEDLPAEPKDEFFEAVLRVGPDAHLTMDAVLAFHDLALVNPRRIRVGLPRRTRRHLPAQVEVITEHRPTSDLTTYEGIPSVTVAQALLDCKGIVMTDRLGDAADEARQRGLLTRTEHHDVRLGLGLMVEP